MTLDENRIIEILQLWGADDNAAEEAANDIMDLISKGLTTERYENHAVFFKWESFTIEHPVTCDLGACDLHERASEAWQERPAEMGWFGLADDLSLSPVSKRKRYAVVLLGEEN